MTWTDISGDLPNAPVNDVVIAGSDLVAATDIDVFVTRDGGTTWLRPGGNLPAVPVMDLCVHTGTQTLTAATFGHGIQRVDLPVAAGHDRAKVVPASVDSRPRRWRRR